MFNTTSERHNEFVGPIRIDLSPGETTGEITTGPKGPLAFRSGSTGNPRKTSEGADTNRMTDKESPLADIYTLLGVSQMSPMEGVRTRYYKLTRGIHRELLNTTDIDRRNKLLYDLKFICIAYDILSDPVTRTDYDLRTMGLRGESMVQTPEEKKPGELGQRLHLKIGELLNVAGLLEGSELEIACDMHKAMPEMQFGSFLVKQGFIEEYQLEAVLFAQKLLRKGLITVVQYQAAMEELESSGVPVAETVVERGYVTQSDLDHLEEVEAEAEAELNRPVTTPVYTQPPLQPKIDEQITSHSNLLAQMLPPGSPDVVSARASGNGEKAAGILGKLLSGSKDGDVTAPPSTMGGLLKGASSSASNPVVQAPAAASAPPSQPAPPPAAPNLPAAPPLQTTPTGKEQKEPRKKRNIELHEVAQAFDPSLNRSANQDVASDTYEGAAYKEELLKPDSKKTDNQRDTGELSKKIELTGSQAESYLSSGPELFGADDIDPAFNATISPGEPDTASSDQLGFMDASSGVEFPGFVDAEERVSDDDEDENEDEEEDDEGNITLIDSGAAIVDASLPPAVDADAELDLHGSGRDKTTDSTHERIPAFAFTDRALHELDSASGDQQPKIDVGQASGDDINSKKAQSTTRDRIPAFRPPLHNTFQLDENEQSGEVKQEDSESGDRQLVISNAVPSWKDNLEWNAPDHENQEGMPPTTASQESEVVDISRHLDLEAIEPQNKPDDELKSFLGEEYREELNDETGRPLWDVEDDEFIIPSKQKRSGQANNQANSTEEEERLAKEKRMSGGWQRLKNPFELQLDSQSGRTTITGEEAIVEVPPQEALESSRSETLDMVRPSIPGVNQFPAHADPATASTDSIDSFVESTDSLESPEEEESFHTPLKGSSNPSIVIGLDDAEEAAAENMEAPDMARQVPTVEPPIIDEDALAGNVKSFVDEDLAVEAVEVTDTAEADIIDDADALESLESAEAIEGIPDAAIPVFEEEDDEEEVSMQSDDDAVQVEAEVVDSEEADEQRSVSITSLETNAYVELADEVSEPELPEVEITDEQSAEHEGAAQEDLAAEETSEDEAAQDKTAQDEAARDEAARDDAAPDEDAKDESAGDESSEGESAEDEAAQDAVADNVALDEEAERKAATSKDASEVAAADDAEIKKADADGTTSTSDEAVAPATSTDDEVQGSATAETSDNGTANAKKEQEDDTAGDDKAAANADAESALSKRRRMLGRRHHRGK